MFMTKERFQASLNSSFADGARYERDRFSEVKKEIEVNRLNSFLGKFVICISNEISNPVVAVAKRIEFITASKEPVLIVHDLVDNKEYVSFGKIFAYTKQKFDALNMLSSHQRIALFYEQDSDTDYVSNSEPRNTLYNKEEWAKLVNDSMKIWLTENEHNY